MKRVTVPEPEEVLATNDRKELRTVKFGLCQLREGTEGYETGVWGYLDREIWTSDFWRTGSPDKIQVVIKLVELFAQKVPGTKVEMTDREHEMLVEAAMQKGKNLDPATAPMVLRLLKSLVNAEDVKETA